MNSATADTIPTCPIGEQQFNLHDLCGNNCYLSLRYVWLFKTYFFHLLLNYRYPFNGRVTDPYSSVQTHLHARNPNPVTVRIT